MVKKGFRRSIVSIEFCNIFSTDFNSFILFFLTHILQLSIVYRQQKGLTFLEEVAQFCNVYQFVSNNKTWKAKYLIKKDIVHIWTGATIMFTYEVTI